MDEISHGYHRCLCDLCSSPVDSIPAFPNTDSVADPNPDPDTPDPHVFGPPGSGFRSSSQRYGSGSGSFYQQAKIVRKNLDSYCFVTYF
jgi:hypothetical protein